MQKAANHYYQLAKQLPAGFKNVFSETRDSLPFRKSRYEGKPLSRRQELTLKKNTEALSKLAVFAVLQTVPVAGWFPIVVALTYPRFLLTHHFWSEEQKTEFMREEYTERCIFTSQLKDYITHQSSSIRSPFTIGDKSFSSLKNLSPQHVHLLACANAVHGNILFQTFTPTFYTRIKIQDMAAFILRDDILLLSEGIEELSEEELREALLQRGIDHTSDNNDHKSILNSWLKVHDPVPIQDPSHLLHLVALSKLQERIKS